MLRMKLILVIAGLLITIAAVSQNKTKSVTERIVGTFIIDLRPTPTSQPYLKEFTFTNIEGNKFDGEFYGYPFTGGLLNLDWGKVYFAFTTQDQSGTYYHSGFIKGNKVSGITLHEARGFVLPWKGEKKKKK
jgi:hypothetical protein